MRWLATLTFSSSTGTRWAKLLWARTSRVSSSSLVSVTAWLLPLAIRTPDQTFHRHHPRQRALSARTSMWVKVLYRPMPPVPGSRVSA